MKKEYMFPMLKSLDVNEEQLMLNVSIEGDHLITSDGEGDAGTEGLSKSSIWDE